MTIHDKHVAKLAEKYSALEGKQALLQMWEEPDKYKTEYDHDYLIGLRKRVRSLKVQLEAMRPPPMWSDNGDYE